MIETLDHGPVRELRLARPPANALDRALIEELAARVRAAPAEGAGALVISGSPGMFSGGLDVPALLALDREGVRALWRAFYDMMRALAASEVPVCAAITGHAPAGGAVISIFCDHRIMADGPFRIGLNEVQVGLVVPPVIQYAARRLTGPGRGDALLVTGALLSPREALAAGLVDEVCGPDEVVPRALAWAERLVALPRAAMLETRRLARADLVAQLEAVGEPAYEAVTERWFGEETQAALRRVLERLGKK
ncbi:MAG TPA: enoyl-CoA hydratase/isomerase family protein [Longimicrobiales bacterium]|nr:enoyl-CoA hydratase/isomerase family protein [Longimicrobiales bacterium]